MDDSLRQRWRSSVARLAGELRSQLSQSSGDEDTEGVVSSASTTWLDKVATLYAEPHRAYHNMNHVVEVLASLDMLMGTPPDSDDGAASADVAITTLAAFFHDVIYNPKSATNEKDSADMFVEFALELLHALRAAHSDDAKQQSSVEPSAKQCPMVSRIEQCIVATATHIASANEARQSNNTVVATFLDADMSILGRDKDGYDRYAGSIRKEYKFVERDVYCEKRAEILDSFLPKVDDAQSNSAPDTRQHSYIYATEKGRKLWENQARQNLRREIDMLRRGIIPLEK